MNELTCMCIQEGMRLKGEEHHTALAVTHGAINKKGKYRKFKKNSPRKEKGHGEGNQAHKGFTVKCYFCGKKGRVKGLWQV